MNATSVAVLLLIIVGFSALRIPIYLTLLTATLYLQNFVNHMSMQASFQALVETIAKSSLLCIPFFILAGNFMQVSTLGDRLVNLFVTLLKRVRGGFAIAALVANAFFGAISGSSPAAVATFGNVIFKPLEKLYGTKTSLGLLTSSGALSIIIPPSITLVVYGVATNSSVAKLFMAGLLPGILIVLIVSVYLIIKCKPVSDEEVEAITGKTSLGKAFLNSLPVMVLPIIILGGIYGGIFTPTEAAAVAAIYACVGALALRDLKLSDIPKVLINSCKTAGQLMVLIASSCAFAQAVVVAQIPAMIQRALAGTGKYGFLLLLNLLLLVVGCLFETASAVLILAPLVLPTALALGIDPIHLGIVFTVNLAIGMFTPPFGLNIFVVQGVLHKGMGEISRAVLPFIVLYFGACLILTYVPQISLLLPGLLF